MRISDWSSDVCSSDLWAIIGIDPVRGGSGDRGRQRRIDAQDLHQPAELGDAAGTRGERGLVVARHEAVEIEAIAAVGDARGAAAPGDNCFNLKDRKSTRLNSSH